MIRLFKIMFQDYKFFLKNKFKRIGKKKKKGFIDSHEAIQWQGRCAPSIFWILKFAPYVLKNDERESEER